MKDYHSMSADQMSAELREMAELAPTPDLQECYQRAAALLGGAQGAAQPNKAWQCLAVSKAACAWPDCGCDPEATKVIAALVEQGWQAPKEVEAILARSSERIEEGPTPEMVDAALNAWFASPPSETDQGLERSMKAALVAAGIDLSASGRTTYEWRDVAELPPWDEQPGRQFIRLEGSRDHSGVNWHRVYCGIAYIRRLGEPDEMLGYRDTDIIQLCDEGDMDLFSATVTHWMPARFPAIPAPVSGSMEGGNGS